MVQTGISCGTNLLDPHGLRPYAIQLFGDRRQFYGRSNFKRVLSGQPECVRCRNPICYSNRRGYYGQRSQRILAGIKPARLSKTPREKSVKSFISTERTGLPSRPSPEIARTCRRQRRWRLLFENLLHREKIKWPVDLLENP